MIFILKWLSHIIYKGLQEQVLFIIGKSMCGTKVHISLFEKVPWIDDIISGKEKLMQMKEFEGIPFDAITALIQHYTLTRLVIMTLSRSLAVRGYYFSQDRVSRYMKKLFDNVTADPLCYVIAIIYMDRLLEKKELDSPAEPLLFATVKKIYSISLMLACKMWEDRVYLNSVYQRDFGLTSKLSFTEFNTLERDVLRELGYELYLSTEDFTVFVEKNRNLFATIIQNDLMDKKMFQNSQ
jgi:hypothetical protein